MSRIKSQRSVGGGEIYIKGSGNISSMSIKFMDESVVVCHGKYTVRALKNSLDISIEAPNNNLI